MRTLFKKAWVVGAVLALALAACGKQTDGPASGDTGKGDGSDAISTWVIDMRADKDVKGKYGNTGRFFWGVEMGTELTEFADVAKGLAGIDQLATQQFIQVFTQAAGAPLLALQQSGCAAEGCQDPPVTFRVIWDQLQDLTPGYPTLMFADAASAKAGIQVMAAAYGVSYQVVVIDAKGRYVAAPGKLNIIPMLTETPPALQANIVNAMQDGDVISYVHPEYTGFKNIMERRASHVAMHYELQVGPRKLVHHVDNPNGYGPEYNHKPNRHMPFHAFRFKPTADNAAFQQQYGLAARNWAMVTNDLSPFAGFFDLRLKSENDIQAFVTRAMNGQDIPNLYCSGLAYANLNLGINRPFNQANLVAWLGAERDTRQWNFSDAERNYGADDLGKGLETLPPWNAQADKLVFAPYSAVDMLNVWVDNTFRGIPQFLSQAQTGCVDAQGAPAVCRPVFELATIQGMPDSPEKQQLLGLYQAGQAAMPQGDFRLAVVSGVVMSQQFQQQVVGGFSQLEWGEPTRQIENANADTNAMPPASVNNAALWASALKATSMHMDAATFRACLSTPLDQMVEGSPLAACKHVVNENHNPSEIVASRTMGLVGLEAAIGKVSSEDPAAAPAIQSAQTPMQLIKALANAKGAIDNRFVPPRIWLDAAEDKVNGNLSYVGTVINCELLTDAFGASNPCDGSGGESESYKEGGSDSHTYATFGVRAKGQITHRRVDASNGPKTFGPGTKVTVKLTAGRPQDIVFSLAVPAMWQAGFQAYAASTDGSAIRGPAESDPIVFDTMGMAVWDYGDICTQRQLAEPLVSTCVPSYGIQLSADTDDNGTPDFGQPFVFPALLKKTTIDLFGDNAPCRILGDANDEAAVAECVGIKQFIENGETQYQTVKLVVPRTTQNGYFVATMINTSDAVAGPSECDVRKNLVQVNPDGLEDLDGDGDIDINDDPSALKGCHTGANSAHFDVWRIEVWRNRTL